MLNITRRHANRIIGRDNYEGRVLIINQVKSKKGKPTAMVLWDTETNQPATPGDTDHADPTAIIARNNSRINPVAGINNSRAESPPAQPRPSPELDDDRSKTAAGCANGPSIALSKKSNQNTQAQTVALQKTAYMAVDDHHSTMDNTIALPPSLAVIDGQVVDTETAELMGMDVVQAYFEHLLWLKIKDKPASTGRSLKAYYRQLFAKTGQVPPALCVGEGRRYAGKRREIDRDIEKRFIDMVIKSADISDIFNYYTQDQRKVTVFHQQLEKEFGRKIPINQLYTVVRACQLKPYLTQSDDQEDDEKTPSYFKSEPVGALVQMDGVEADYLEILDGDRWRKPIWIELMDFGSRRLSAMHAYLSESNENSVDIFTRFLSGNEFAHQPMKIRPDNAKGFLNLKRPIHELNHKYARENGFIFLDDFSRAGTPKDKAHLESSHRKAHKDLERNLIDHFKDRIHSQYKKQKKVGNRMKTVTVTRLSISLEELNASGQTEAYRQQHNNNKHRFTEDGVQRVWVPDERWQAYLTGNDTFAFKVDDIELCRRYGYAKAAATIDKNGCITHQKRKFYVDNKDHWNRQSATKVKVSLIGDHLAYFKAVDDGEWLGNALPLQAPVKSEKVIDKETAKIVKIHAENEYHGIVDQLKRIGMIVNDGKLRQMLDDGLTPDMISRLLVEKAENYAKKPGTFVPFNLFASDVKKLLHDIKKKKLIPYAGESKHD